MAFNGNCFRCEEPGHVAAECPELRPAQNRQEHEHRLDTYRQRFDNWLTPGATGVKWTPEEKKRAIETENRMWKKAETT